VQLRCWVSKRSYARGSIKARNGGSDPPKISFRLHYRNELPLSSGVNPLDGCTPETRMCRIFGKQSADGHQGLSTNALRGTHATDVSFDAKEGTTKFYPS